MTDLYVTPALDAEDDRTLGQIGEMRADLADVLRAPTRWTGNLRRNAQARAIRGSNSIEGYVIDNQDAIAAVDDDEPMTADEKTWAEILGYRRVLTYVLQMADEPGFAIDSRGLRMLHYMLLEHDLSKGPGRFRPGDIYVHDEKNDERVYRGPPADIVPGLVEALLATLTAEPDTDPMVRAAMAHLNLVMVHPFRDGNGRMARALQTLVLAQDSVLEPTFASIEEWLGANTEDYYRILAVTGQGQWNPHLDAHRWVKFVLRAHHMQAQTLTRRFAEAGDLWLALDELLAGRALPERVFEPLFDAALGLRVRRPTYVKRADIEERTASRDLARLVEEGLLLPHGQTKGRYYVAGQAVQDLTQGVRAGRARMVDPYPQLIPDLHAASRGRPPSA